MTIRYRRRELTSVILDALANMPVVVVTGMRQVGKSTLLQEELTLKKRRYITLDDFAQLEVARSNPETLLAGDTPVTIDEAQRCPELLLVIKRLVDARRQPGRFLLSGSANFALLKDVAESLAGRAVYLTLHPFTRREITGETDVSPFLPRFFETLAVPKRPINPVEPREVLLGGMPPVCLPGIEKPVVWFQGYEQTYIERDLRQLSQVADLFAFRRFMQLAALRTGQILNLSELARDAQLPTATASRYLTLLETSFVLRRVGAYLGNRASRLIKAPKLYFSDAGLCSYLVGVERFGAVNHEPLRGALFETYVMENIVSILESHWTRARLFFWHVQGRYEVDCVIEVGREVVAIEIKTNSRWRANDLTSLRAFLQRTAHCRAAILAYNGTQAVQLDQRLWAIPLGLLLS